jgi:hypothetical protein
MNPDVLRALIEAAARQPAAPTSAASQPDALEALHTALISSDQPAPANEAIAAPLSPIDNALGGQALAGKKTALAIVLYALLSLLQANDIVGYATGPDYKGPTAAPATTAPHPTTGVPAGTATTTQAAAEAAATSAKTDNGRTPTGVTLTTLILAFGALGLLAKVDRATNAMSVAAGAGTPT